MKSDEQILAELKEAIDGLLWMSESDYPFEVIYLKGKTEPSHQQLCEMAGVDKDSPVEARSIEDFFRVAISEPEWKRGEALILAKRHQSLVKLLQENLRDIRVYRVGEINIPIFILGKVPWGNWIGLSTRVIET